MRVLFKVGVVKVTLVFSILLGQSALAQVEPVLATAAATPPTLARDTPVPLMVMSEVTTKTATAGHRFMLRTTAPLTIAGAVIVPTNTPAWGEVVTAKASGAVGKGGQLTAKLLYLDLDGRHIALTGETSSKARKATGDVVMGVVGMGILGLLARGNNAKLKAGEALTGFIAEDTVFSATPSP